MLILGCPTQGMRQTPAMQSFIAHIPHELLSFNFSIACFDIVSVEVSGCFPPRQLWPNNFA